MYAFTTDVPIDTELYWKIIDELGSQPQKGSLLHLCFRRADGSLHYLDVWSSKQDCAAAFADRIHPAVDAAFGGARPDREPSTDPFDLVHASGSLLGEEFRA